MRSKLRVPSEISDVEEIVVAHRQFFCVSDDELRSSRNGKKRAEGTESKVHSIVINEKLFRQRNAKPKIFWDEARMTNSLKYSSRFSFSSALLFQKDDGNGWSKYFTLQTRTNEDCVTKLPPTLRPDVLIIKSRVCVNKNKI